MTIEVFEELKENQNRIEQLKFVRGYLIKLFEKSNLIVTLNAYFNGKHEELEIWGTKISGNNNLNFEMNKYDAEHIIKSIDIQIKELESEFKNSLI